jgi:(1->4)-alpha-D-glucan 1-alpha-D-glucosylmutase
MTPRVWRQGGVASPIEAKTWLDLMPVADPIAALLDKVASNLLAGRRFPGATYRLQFHAGFTFRDACYLVPYLHELGITDCYASPYLKARPGSTHGYDICDHNQLNPEIGSAADYAAWVQALQAHGMGQMLDIVPNHMGVVGNENAWWNDVLENGPSSPYATYFDIDWYPLKPALRGKVLLPILGDPYGKVLEALQLSLSYEGGAFTAHYFDHRLPIAPETGLHLLRHRLEELERQLDTTSAEFMEYQSILTALTHLPARMETEPQKMAERHREKEVIKRRLATLVDASCPVRAHIERNLAIFNGQTGDPHGLDLLDALLNDQAYRLSFWRVASDEINYRRFFDVNELVALNMEKEEVFRDTHGLILQLLREGKVTGLRIDHPDGLYDPGQYLRRLQEHFILDQARALVASEPEYKGERAGEWEGPLLQALGRASGGESGDLLRRPLYIVVEKILERDEPIPIDWPIHGTTGYAFLNELNGLFVDHRNAGAFSRLYHRWTRTETSFRDLVYQKKFLILQVSLSGELHMLAHQLDQLSEKNRWSRDFTLNSLRHALREIIACFPVYRSYISERDIHEHDHLYIEAAVLRAKQKNPAISASIFEFVRDLLLLRYPTPASAGDRAEHHRFVGKFQQVTGPVTAKGVEDTAFYVYNRLVALNEVGGAPDRFGVSLADFHRYNRERRRHWPYALSTSSTHDTKRSEDVRARLNVLSEMPQEWQKCLARWHRLNKRHRIEQDGLTIPDRNDEYLLYQTLIGAWPLPGAGAEDFTEFGERIRRYMQKAVHEAKVHTSWINPNPVYDEGIARFVTSILDEKSNGRFLQDVRSFHKRVSHYGLFNSLAQTLLKIASPGVPDTYQGTELWDFSLVDPDNRRPVDYALRQRMLHELKERLGKPDVHLPDFARELTTTKEDGRIKLYVTWKMLHFRREHADWFTRGEYHPVDAHGSRREHVCAFLRRFEARWALAVAPRLLTRVQPGGDGLPLGPDVWQDTLLLLPGVGTNLCCRNIFTDEVLTTLAHDGQAALRLAEVLANFPVALLVAEDALAS